MFTDTLNKPKLLQVCNGAHTCLASRQGLQSLCLSSKSLRKPATAVSGGRSPVRPKRRERKLGTFLVGRIRLELLPGKPPEWWRALPSLVLLPLHPGQICPSMQQMPPGLRPGIQLWKLRPALVLLASLPPARSP